MPYYAIYNFFLNYDILSQLNVHICNQHKASEELNINMTINKDLLFID